MAAHSKKPSIRVQVFDQPKGSHARHPIHNALVSVKKADGTAISYDYTDAEGRAVFVHADIVNGGTYQVGYENTPSMGGEHEAKSVTVHGASNCDINLGLDARVRFTLETGKQGVHPRVGESIVATISFNGNAQQYEVHSDDPHWSRVDPADKLVYTATMRTPGIHVFRPTLRLPRKIALRGFRDFADNEPKFGELRLSGKLSVEEAPPTPISGSITVGKTRTASFATLELALDEEIARSTAAMSFCNYMNVINKLFCKDKNGRQPPCDPVRPLGPRVVDDVKHAMQTIEDHRALPFIDADSYRVLKAATEAFVMVNCAVADSTLTTDERVMLDTFRRRDIGFTPGTVDYADYLGAGPNNPGMLPYLAIIRRKLPDVPISDMDLGDAELCFGILQRKLSRPCMVELIWSYWHEEAMLVQTMNVITRRFQNVGSGSKLDPLANLEIDPLRPLNNLIWGYVQDEQHRLTVVRRSYEYDHHYGLRLDGRAIKNFRPADSRSRFLEAFHQLLRRLNAFYRQDDDTNVKADAFPVLNAIKEVHMILSQGAHNQFGDLPSTARVEMLMQQWLLARPEFREFLPTRIMVAYPEPWMDRVDAMKKLQGWSDISVMHFNALAGFGEQLLLSIRYGAWSTMFEPLQAFNWARLWRPQVQGYIHSYRAVTGVDLTTEQPDPAADGTLPSVLLRRRLEEQARRERRP